MKVGDKVTVKENEFRTEQGIITEIYEAPHPYRSSDKLLTWYRIFVQSCGYQLSTCDKKMLTVIN